MFYKEKARAYFSAVNSYDIVEIESRVDENYIQHNPLVPSGRAAFLEFIPKLKQSQSKITNIRMLEDAQYVIMHHRWNKAFPFGAENTVAFHIIRFNTQSLIAEHWSVMTEDLSDSVGGSLSDGSSKIEDLHKTHENKTRVTELFEILTKTSTENLSHKIDPFFLKNLSNLGRPFKFASSDVKYVKQHRVFGEGNFSLSIAEGFYGGVHSALYDLFCFKNERIVEHWRVVQAIPSENLANTNTMFGF